MNAIDFQLQNELKRAKWAFTTRRVHRADAVGIRTDYRGVVSGDLVLAKVTRLGQHRRIQLPEGRPSELYVDDLIVASCADRYAPDQFEAVAELDPAGADLVAGGGVIGKMRVANQQMRTPTRVEPLGLLTDASGEVINVARYALPAAGAAPAGLTVIGVIGASMNAGKTTAAASLGHGLGRAGYRVAGLKITGTGAYGDYNTYRDAGLDVVADFTDAGMASTYRQPIERIEAGFCALTQFAAAEGAEIAVVELADGIFQDETARLLRSNTLRRTIDGFLFAVPDALGAVGGLALLRRIGIEPFALSGLLSRSPLAVAETQSATAVRLVTRAELCDPAHALALTQTLLPARASLRQVAA